MAVMNINTARAVGRLKTVGTFIAGGLVGGLIAGALQHGWSYAVSNGFDPFGDGGHAIYKQTNARTGTATRAGFAVRPLTASAGQGEHFTMAVIPAYIIPAAEAATPGGNTAGQGNTIPANAASGSGGSHPATSRQPPTVTATLAANPSGSQRQPVGQPATHKAAKAVAAKPQPTRQSAPSKAAKAVAAKPQHKQVLIPFKTGRHSNSNRNWVDRLMPGKPTPAVYYSYNANPSAKEKPAPANSWVGKLMTDGSQKVKVNSGKVGMATHKKSDLHTGAGQTGKALTGGSGDFPNWSEGKASKDKVMVCIKDECV